MPCNFQKTDHGTYQCSQCGFEYNAKFGPNVKRQNCHTLNPRPVRPTHAATQSSFTWPNGPGTILHRKIKKRLGEDYQAGCGCEDMVNQMNAWAPAGCRAHLNEIIAKMLAEAKKRPKWKLAVSLPGAKLFIKRMVLSAIREAEG